MENSFGSINIRSALLLPTIDILTEDSLFLQSCNFPKGMLSNLKENFWILETYMYYSPIEVVVVISSNMTILF